MQFARRGALVAAAATAFALFTAAPAAAVHFLYVTNGSASGSTSGYSIGPGATLTPIPGASDGTGVFPRALAVTPDAKRLYVSGFGLTGFDIAADGSLTAIAGGPFGAGQSYGQITISPDGTRLYAAGQFANQVFGFAIGDDGALSALPGSPYNAGTFTFGVALTPDGDHLYAANGNSDNISIYQVLANGSLGQIPGSPTAGGDGPNFLGITPSGNHLYVADFNEPAVRGFSINANGTLSAVAGSPFVTGADPWGATVSPDGRTVYVGSQGASNISGFAIGPSGTLLAVPGSPLAAGGTGTREVAITADGSAAFAANLTTDDVSRFSRDSTSGELTLVAPTAAATDAATGAVITPNQPPAAGYTATADKRTVTFTSTTTDPDTALAGATFSWDFGDGAALNGAAANPTHDYAADGTYDVRLTVTDAEGCSTFPVYPGQTLYCNGGPGATVVQPVIVDSILDGARFKAKRTQKQKRGRVVIKAKAGAAEKVLLTVSNGKVKLPGAKLKLKKVKQANVAAGELGKLKLKPKGKRATEQIEAALRAGRKVKASFEVRLEDDAGNSAVRTLKVKLR